MSNSGVFDVNDIRYLMDYQQWSGVGTLELIQSESISNGASTVDILSIKENEYDQHILMTYGVEGSTSPQINKIRFYESGVLETGSNYRYSLRYNQADGGTNEEKSTGDTSITNFAFNNTSNEQSCMMNIFYNLGDATKYSFATLHSISAFDVEIKVGGGCMTQASIVDGIQMYPHTGTYAGGNYSLYGVKYA